MTTDTVRTINTNMTPEEKRELLRRYTVSSEDSERETSEPVQRGQQDSAAVDPKARRRMEREQEREREAAQRAREQEQEAMVAAFAPIIFTAGRQAVDRLTPSQPYSMDEATQLTAAIVAVADKHGSWFAAYKEELALAMVLLAQGYPRYVLYTQQRAAMVQIVAPPQPTTGRDSNADRTQQTG